MTDSNSNSDPDTPDWIPHSGGSRPVPEDQIVEYRLRNGKTYVAPAGRLVWLHLTRHYDIVAYRLYERDPDEASPQ